MAEIVNNLRISPKAVILFTAMFSIFAAAQITKELRFKVGRKPLVAITNDYGWVSIEPSENNQVIVTTLTRSDAVRFTSEQRSNRIELRANTNFRDGEVAEYRVLVPPRSVVTLRSSEGKVHVLGLNGDVIVETTSAAVEVADISDGHVHIKTLSGAIALSNIRRSHLEINSIGGDLRIQNVAESTLDAHSGSGRILYDGDPGKSGNYTLTSHTGNLEVSIPVSASVDIRSRSLLGEADQDVASLDAGPATNQKNRFLPRRKTGASRFVLQSFKGRIRITRP
jgi:DUF4097 and DUF4098 domain-containing protein YvlB